MKNATMILKEIGTAEGAISTGPHWDVVVHFFQGGDLKQTLKLENVDHYELNALQNFASIWAQGKFTTF